MASRRLSWRRWWAWPVSCSARWQVRWWAERYVAGARRTISSRGRPRHRRVSCPCLCLRPTARWIQTMYSCPHPLAANLLLQTPVSNVSWCLSRPNHFDQRALNLTPTTLHHRHHRHFLSGLNSENYCKDHCSGGEIMTRKKKCNSKSSNNQKILPSIDDRRQTDRVTIIANPRPWPLFSIPASSKTRSTKYLTIYRTVIQSLKTCLEARTCLENENPCLEKSGSVLQFE